MKSPLRIVLVMLAVISLAACTATGARGAIDSAFDVRDAAADILAQAQSCPAVSNRLAGWQSRLDGISSELPVLVGVLEVVEDQTPTGSAFQEIISRANFYKGQSKDLYREIREAMELANCTVTPVSDSDLNAVLWPLT